MTSIAIVGTGPSAIYALQALIECRHPLVVTLFEAGEIPGVGTPYDPQANSVEMLANIASVEIPPVGQSLIDYLAQCDDGALEAVGVSRAALGEREFYPRIALGAYYRDRLAALVAEGRDRGHAVTILTRHRVVDAAPASDGVDIRYLVAGGSPVTLRVDKVILATGHMAPAGTAEASLSGQASAPDEAHDIGILGSSLSAIDVAVSVAGARGRFAEGRYTPDPGAVPFSLTMMSRGGRLPEADFYCPLPAQPADGFTEHDVAVLAATALPGQVLDLVFQRFAKVMGEADPAYADRIGLAGLTADSFPAAYFAERDAQAPFAWARRNLKEARLNHRKRHVVPWRYAILRCHEAFATCLDALTAEERARFNRGLKRVFADNYAAVPPLSVERILALHEAGILKVVKLDEGYEIRLDEETGRSILVSGPDTLAFDRIVDARGQAAAQEDAFPFPTLRLILKANRDLDALREDGAVAVDADYRLTEGANPLRDIWCLSLPFLLDRKPFIQGLTSAAEMGRAAAAAIIASIEVPVARQENPMGELIAMVATTQPIILADRTVMLAPRATSEPKGSDAAGQ